VELQPSAILYSNRALARMNLGKLDESIEDSTQAIKEDPTYVKGHWRLAQAHIAKKNNKEALLAFEDAIRIEPTNKAIKKELEKCKAKVEQDDMFDDGPPPISPVKASKSQTISKTTSSKSTSSIKNSSPAPPSAPTPSEETDASEFNKSDHVRGYKLNKDGKKTSFFNNDLTPEAKALIGDIAPKKINSAMEAATPAMKKAEEGVSVWNSAGTWEEKDVSKWAVDSFTACLSGISLDLSCGRVECGDLKLNESSASVVKVRGKRRNLFDFNCTVPFEAEIDGESVKGKANFADIAPDCDGEYECQIEWDETPGNAVRMKANKHIRDGKFKEEVESRVGAWVESFKAKYS